MVRYERSVEKAEEDAIIKIAFFAMERASAKMDGML